MCLHRLNAILLLYAIIVQLSRAGEFDDVAGGFHQVRFMHEQTPQLTSMHSTLFHVRPWPAGAAAQKS